MCFSFNLQKQKHLVLCNFKELYQQIRSKNPNYMIEFSQFPSLQLKWCDAIAAPGTQSVCAYSFHQTVVLLCSASRLKVCNSQNMHCMIHRCSECPERDSLKHYVVGNR